MKWGASSLESWPQVFSVSCPKISLRGQTYVVVFPMRKWMTISRTFAQTIILNVGLWSIEGSLYIPPWISSNPKVTVNLWTSQSKYGCPFSFVRLCIASQNHSPWTRLKIWRLNAIMWPTHLILLHTATAAQHLQACTVIVARRNLKHYPVFRVMYSNRRFKIVIIKAALGSQNPRWSSPYDLCFYESDSIWRNMFTKGPMALSRWSRCILAATWLD